jgi:ankyrin repeat protein
VDIFFFFFRKNKRKRRYVSNQIVPQTNIVFLEFTHLFQSHSGHKKKKVNVSSREETMSSSSTNRTSERLLDAASAGDNELVKKLLATGIDVNTAVEDGPTALQLAAENGHNAVVQTLLKNKAAIDEKEENGWTALHIAAQNGHSEWCSHCSRIRQQSTRSRKLA